MSLNCCSRTLRPGGTTLQTLCDECRNAGNMLRRPPMELMEAMEVCSSPCPVDERADAPFPDISLASPTERLKIPPFACQISIFPTRRLTAYAKIAKPHGNPNSLPSWALEHGVAAFRTEALPSPRSTYRSLNPNGERLGKFPPRGERNSSSHESAGGIFCCHNILCVLSEKRSKPSGFFFLVYLPSATSSCVPSYTVNCTYSNRTVALSVRPASDHGSTRFVPANSRD